MLELRDYARSDELSGFIADPPPTLRPQDGVIGLALAYDPALVRLVADSIGTLGKEGSLEHSAAVAEVLAYVLERNRGGKPEPTVFSSSPEWIADRWSRLSRMLYGDTTSPVIVEITVGPRFPTEPGKSKEPLPASYRKHRIVYRRAARSNLHFAEAGGRFIPLSRPQKWGTLGGFLQALDGSVYAVTAAHVAIDQAVSDREAYGTPAFLGSPGMIRAYLHRLINIDPLPMPKRWQRQRGYATNFSWPERVPELGCRASMQPTTDGLDVGLARWTGAVFRSPATLGVPSGKVLSPILRSRFCGAASGMQEVRICSYSIWHSYAIQGDDLETGDLHYCISDCIQIKLAQRPIYWADVSRGGDSGSWLTAESADGPVWLGMIVGGDGERSGVVPADRILDHFRNDLGPLLPRQ